MEQCKGCYRNAPGGCEAFKHKPKDCFAKITDRETYVKQQTELANYNESRCQSGYTAAKRSIKRAMKGVG